MTSVMVTFADTWLTDVSAPSVSLTASFPSRSSASTLDLWRGRVLLLRDVSGRRVFGTFLSMTVEDIFQPAGTRHFVTLTFTEITYSEGV